MLLADVVFVSVNPSQKISKQNRPLASSISRSQSDKLSRTTL